MVSLKKVLIIHCSFKRKMRLFTAMIVYFDDIVILGNDYTGAQSLKNFLAAQFEIRDLGKLKYFLGAEISRS